MKADLPEIENKDVVLGFDFSSFFNIIFNTVLHED